MKRAAIILLFTLLFFFTVNSSVKAVSLNYQEGVVMTNYYFPIYELVKQDYSKEFINSNLDEYLVFNRKRYFLIKGDKYFVGYVKEWDGWGTVDNETMVFIEESIKSKRHQQKDYEASLTAWYQVVEGIIMGKEISLNKDFNLEIHGKLLQGLQLRQLNYKGHILEDEDRYYMKGIGDSINSEVKGELCFEEGEFESLGFSLGGSVKKEISSDLRLELSVNNLYSRIKWENVYTEVSEYKKSPYLDSYLENEFVPYKEGNCSLQDYVTSLTPEYNLRLITSRNEIGFFYFNEFYPYISHKIVFSPIEIKAEIYREFFGLKLNYKEVNLDLKTKNLNFKSSSGIIVNIGHKLDF